MSKAAVQHSRNFDWDRITEQWIGIFQELVVNRKAA
jgi:hypothetical protein